MKKRLNFLKSLVLMVLLCSGTQVKAHFEEPLLYFVQPYSFGSLTVNGRTTETISPVHVFVPWYRTPVYLNNYQIMVASTCDLCQTGISTMSVMDISAYSFDSLPGSYQLSYPLIEVSKLTISGIDSLMWSSNISTCDCGTGSGTLPGGLDGGTGGGDIIGGGTIIQDPGGSPNVGTASIIQYFDHGKRATDNYYWEVHVPGDAVPIGQGTGSEVTFDRNKVAVQNTIIVTFYVGGMKRESITIYGGTAPDPVLEYQTEYIKMGDSWYQTYDKQRTDVTVYLYNCQTRGLDLEFNTSVAPETVQIMKGSTATNLTISRLDENDLTRVFAEIPEYFYFEFPLNVRVKLYGYDNYFTYTINEPSNDNKFKRLELPVLTHRPGTGCDGNSMQVSLNKGEWTQVSLDYMANTIPPILVPYEEPYYTINKQGGYLVVANYGYCRKTGSAVIPTIINGKDLDISPSEMKYCQNADLTVNITNFNTLGTDSAFVWFNNGAIQHLTSPSLLFRPNPGIIRFYSLSKDGCQSTVKQYNVSYIDPVAINSHTLSKEVCEGENFTLESDESGEIYSYQWYLNGQAIAGANQKNYTATADTLKAGNYTLKVFGVCDTLTTNSIPVTVKKILRIHQSSPSTIVLCPGQTFTASVVATGTNLTYQWYHNNNLLSGQNSPTLMITSVTADKAGIYRLEIRDDCSSGRTYITNLVVRENLAITSTPNDTILCPGDPLSLVFGIQGDANSYSWTLDGKPLTSGVDGLTYNTTASANSAGNYILTIVGTCATVHSSPVNITVNKSTVITSQPSSVTVCPGGHATFSVEATGTNLTYQWYHGNDSLTGQTHSSLILTDIQSAKSGVYRVKISGECETIFSENAILTVREPLSISAPSNQVLCSGNVLNLSFLTQGDINTYSWTLNGNPITDNVNNSTYSVIAGVEHTGIYVLAVTGPCGTKISSPVNVTVNPLIVVTKQPVDETLCPGETFAASVEATGLNLSYQWYKDNSPLTDKTSPTLVLTSVNASNAGSYWVKINGICGPVNSDSTVLTVRDSLAINGKIEDVELCSDLMLNLNHDIQGDAELYQWYLNGNLVSESATSAAYETIADTTKAGVYVLKVKGICGEVESPATLVKVNKTEELISAPSSADLCPGESFDALVVANGTDLTYQWAYDSIDMPGKTGSSLTICSVTYEDAGSYTVKVKGICGTFETSPAVLTVRAGIHLDNALQDVQACIGETLTFENPLSNAQGISSAWFINSNQVSTEDTYTYVASGLQRVDTISIKLMNSCDTIISSALISLNKQPEMPLVQDNLWTCYEGTVAVQHQNPEAGIRYAIEKDGNPYPVNGKRFFTYDADQYEGEIIGETFDLSAGNYLFKAENLNFGNCASEKAFEIIDNKTDFNLSMTDDKSLCSQDELKNLFDYVIGGEQALMGKAYQWNIINESNDAQENVTDEKYMDSKALAPGFYRFVLAVTDGRCDTIVKTRIEIMPSPEVLTLEGDTAICNGAYGAYSVTTNSDNLHYAWYINDAVVQEGTGSTYQNTFADNIYDIYVLAKNSYGCERLSNTLNMEAVTVVSEYGFDALDNQRYCQMETLDIIDSLMLRSDRYSEIKNTTIRTGEYKYWFDGRDSLFVDNSEAQKDKRAQLNLDQSASGQHYLYLHVREAFTSKEAYCEIIHDSILLNVRPAPKPFMLMVEGFDDYENITFCTDSVIHLYTEPGTDADFYRNEDENRFAAGYEVMDIIRAGTIIEYSSRAHTIAGGHTCTRHASNTVRVERKNVSFDIEFNDALTAYCGSEEGENVNLFDAMQGNDKASIQNYMDGYYYTFEGNGFPVNLGGSFNTSNPSITLGTTYPVDLHIEKEGCSRELNTNVVVYPQVGAATLNVSETNICGGTEVTFTMTAANASVYRLMNGNTLVVETRDPIQTIPVYESGNYYFEALNASCASRISDEVAIEVSPGADAEVLIERDRTVVYVDFYAFSNTSSVEIQVRELNGELRDSEEFSVSEVPEFKEYDIVRNIAYNLDITLMSDIGCDKTYHIAIPSSTGEVYEGLLSEYQSVANISITQSAQPEQLLMPAIETEEQADKFEAVLLPTVTVSGSATILKVSAPTSGEAQMRIMTLEGQLLSSQKIGLSQGQNETEMNRYCPSQAGMYVIHLVYPDQTQETLRWIVQ